MADSAPTAEESLIRDVVKILALLNRCYRTGDREITEKILDSERQMRWALFRLRELFPTLAARLDAGGEGP
jgi:hypothetical protein